MPDRNVKVVLSAQVAAYKKGMEEAARATATVGTEGQKLAQIRQVMDSVGRGGLAMGALLGAGLTVAIAKFADFDSAMSNVQAATLESADGMEKLRAAAIEAGSSTVFSATESANAIEELAKAGVSTADILNGGLRGALDLAAAGGLGVADAAGIAATSIKQFNLQGEDMAHVADLLSAGAGKALGDVSDLSQALNQVGLVANSTGLTIEETTAGLSAFAEQGLLGSDAGTAFKSMLQRLTPQSAEAQKKMDELGISAYDASGNFIGLAEFAGNLRDGMQKLTPEARNAAMAVIFGSDAVRASNVLYAQGEEGIRDWISAVDDQGFAAEQARIKLDNLKGDIEALQGAIDAAFIETGSAGNDVIRDMVQALTGLVDIYNELPEPVKASVFVIGGATAAIALAGGTALLAVPKIVEFKAAMQSTGFTLGRTALAAGGAGLALGGLFAIVGQLAAEHAEARQRAQAYADTLEEGTNRVTKATRNMVKENLAVGDSWLFFSRDSAYTSAEKLGISLDLVTDAAMGSADALKELDAILVSGEDGSLDYANAAADIRDGVKGESESMAEAIRVAEQKNRVTDEGIGITEDAASAYVDAANEASQLNSTLKELLDTVNESNGVGQDAVTQNLDYLDALAKVDEQIRLARDGVEGYALTLDTGTQAGRDNMAMLVDLASSSQEAAAAQFELDGNTENYRATLEAGRQALIDRMTDLGLTADEASNLADQIYKIPSETEWKMIADTSQASWTIDDFINRYGTLSGTIIYRATLPDLNGDVSGNGRPGFASGGPIFGPGTSTSDSIWARLSNGEHVLTAEEVRAAGGHAKVEEWRAALLNGSHNLTADGPECRVDGVTEVERPFSLSTAGDRVLEAV